MRLRHRLELEHGLTPLDIAPLIDVVFLLLIFFLLTSSFIVQPGIRVNLPKAVTSEVVQERSLVVLVTGENLVYLGDRLVTLADLRTALTKAAKEQTQMLIKADRGASLGRVVEVWDLCREVGIAQINIATHQAGR